MKFGPSSVVVVVVGYSGLPFGFFLLHLNVYQLRLYYHYGYVTVDSTEVSIAPFDATRHSHLTSVSCCFVEA